ncbi:cell division protein SepF [Holzapfeliella sp. He02]|uniref:Cell division protein SepF n=1 Tax=Holzapfeliella saturejae TaxID=3082953 RepID=A0ABU8SG19_9LACO
MAFEKFEKFFGFGDEDIEQETYDYEKENDYQQNETTNTKRDNVVPLNSDKKPSNKIFLFEPRVYSDAKNVAEQVLNNGACIINFSRMEDDQAKRVVDFLTGTVYSLNGKIERVGDKIFLATPPKFEIDGKITKMMEQNKDDMD